MKDRTLYKADLGFLVEAPLIQVAIGENESILHFLPDVTILMQSTTRVTRPGGEAHDVESAVQVGFCFLDLLGLTVSRVDGTLRGSLDLEWSDGTTTEILNNSDQFECYSITHAGGFFVV